jgi:GT2 family glycosyltransferase
MPSFSVVIPATDRRATAQRCLAAVRAAIGRTGEVILVDEPATIGPAAARNVGARRATGDVLVFVDSDIEVHSDAFRRIRSAFADDRDLIAVFGSYDDDPERHGLVSDFRNLLHHHVHQQGAGEASTFWAGLGAVRRKAFMAAGGFDERLRYLEDVDLGMRLRADGGRIRLDPAIQGKHLKRWTLANMLYTDFFGRGIPWIRLLAENRAHSTALNLGWRHRASAAASIALVTSVIRRRSRSAAGSVLVLAWLNGSFYSLLAAKRGWKQVAVGIPLHVLHHLLSVGAVPTGTAFYLRDRFFGSRRSVA